LTSQGTAQFVAKLLAAERRRRGTPCGSRALTCFGQAVLGLRWFRDRITADALARDHGISRATAYRYLDEVIAVLEDQAPDLGQALARARDQGFSHVILDGKVFLCDRCKEPAISARGEVIDLWYSGKAHAHGGNIQAVLAPDGFPLWVSPAEPGSVHDLTAARAHALPALYQAAAANLPILADPGYDGAGIGILIPVKQPPAPPMTSPWTPACSPSTGDCTSTSPARSPTPSRLIRWPGSTSARHRCAKRYSSPQAPRPPPVDTSTGAGRRSSSPEPSIATSYA